MKPFQQSSGLNALGLVALASAALMVFDAQAGSPIGPVRHAVATAVAPVQQGAETVVGPFQSAAAAVRRNSDLRNHVATLEAQNTKLKGELATQPVDRQRLAEYDALTRAARDTGYTLVPAHVVAIGPAQSFSRVVTIDAGTSSGVRPDSTVLSGAGLVGRVVSATRTTATVLLIVDSESVVGGRLGSNLKVGSVRGTGALGTANNLTLSLVDSAATPLKGDVVVTWGSARGGPYVPGIPIGTVSSVTVNSRDLTKTAQVHSLVDFGALDLVGVVVPKNTRSDRALVRAGGSVR